MIWNIFADQLAITVEFGFRDGIPAITLRRTSDGAEVVSYTVPDETVMAWAILVKRQAEARSAAAAAAAAVQWAATRGISSDDCDDLPMIAEGQP